MLYRPSLYASAVVLATSVAVAQSPSRSPVGAPLAGGPFEVGAPTRIDAGRGDSACNETTIALSRANPLNVVSAWNDYREGVPRVGVGLSRDGGLTWSDSILRPPLPFQSASEADPMTASDDRTGALWVGGLSFGPNGGVFVARKDAASPALGPAVMAYSGGGVDKGMMAAGPDPDQPHDVTRLYVAFNQGVIVSADLGETWSQPVPIDMGLGFVPRVGPSGTLYIAYWDTLDQVKLVRSLDGGATLEAPSTIALRLDVWGLDGTRTPGDFRVPAFPTLAVDPVTEDLYCAYPDTSQQSGGEYDVDLYFTRSQDFGLTWSTPAVIRSGGGTPGDQFFPWLDVDSAGRIHLVHYDTRQTPQSDAAPYGWMDAAYSFSMDGGASWSTARLTDVPFSSEHDGFGGIFIGDYLGVATGGGRTLSAYMTTRAGNADAFVSLVTHGAATSYCFGFTCPCGNVDPSSGCGNWGVDGDAVTGARLSSSGSNVVSRDDLELEMSGLRPLSFGLLLAGRNRVSPPFGDGRRCVGGQVYRYPVRRADAAGVLRYGPSEVAAFSASFAPNGLVHAPSTWNYQGWYRDAQGPCGSGFNLTNGLSVVWR